MSAPGHDRRTAQGFTLIEVMITLVILAYGMLTLAIMQLYAMRQGSQGRHTGDGSAIARSYLEQASRVPWSVLDTAEAVGDWTTPAASGWTQGLPSTQATLDRPGLGDAIEHSYTIEWRVTDVGGPPVCLRDVEVRVTWDEEGTSTPKSRVLGTRRYNQGDEDC